MAEGAIISPGVPAAPSSGKPDSRYIRAAAGILRSACAVRGSFTVTGRLAFELAQQRTPQKPDRSWNARALRNAIALALAEIDGLMARSSRGDESAKERIRQLRIEAGYMREASGGR